MNLYPNRLPEEYRQQVRRKFDHHPPTSEAVIGGHEIIRSIFRHAADHLMELLPDDPETHEALDMLDKACMQANAAMARTQGGLLPVGSRLDTPIDGG